VSNSIIRHFKTFWGRPKAHVTQLREQIEQARPRTQHRINRDQDFAERILAGLTDDQRTTLERWIAAQEEDFGLAAAALMLDWMTGEGLNPQLLRRVMREPWGEELVEKYDRDSA
jgi:hypothetical protein